MPSHLPRLRAYRKSAGLSQRELALLLGLRSQSTISQLELGKRRPSLATLIACERLFGAPAQDLFLSVTAGIEARLFARARHLLTVRATAFSARARTYVRNVLSQNAETP